MDKDLEKRLKVVAADLVAFDYMTQGRKVAAALGLVDNPHGPDLAKLPVDARVYSFTRSVDRECIALAGLRALVNATPEQLANFTDAEAADLLAILEDQEETLHSGMGCTR